MRKLNMWAGIILLVVILMISLLVFAKLSDETLEIVEDLRMKHYGQYMFFDADEIVVDWTTFYPYIIYFEDGILYIETQDGKWFIKMEKMEE